MTATVLDDANPAAYDPRVHRSTGRGKLSPHDLRGMFPSRHSVSKHLMVARP